MKTRALLPLLVAFTPSILFAGYYPQWVRTARSAKLDARSIAAADFNSDGRPDLIVRVGTKAVDLIPVDATAKPGTATQIFTSGATNDVALGDFDRDQKADVVAADGSANQLAFLHSNGDGTFAAPVTTALNFVPDQLAAGDFDGDGKLDVAVRSHASSILAIYRGDGSGKFSEGSRIAVSPSSYTMTTGDIDGDHRLDVLVGRTDPLGFDVFYGKGNGSFNNAAGFAADYPSMNFLIADLDHDGDGEILSTEHAEGQLTERLNLGSRTFGSPITYIVKPALQFTNRGAAAALLAADVDSDGKTDVVVTVDQENSIATLIGNGDGTLAPPSYSDPGPRGDYLNPTQAVWGDFNLDGRPDLAYITIAPATVAISLNATGDPDVRVTSKYPVISSGEPITFNVAVDPAAGSNATYGFDPPFPTGTVTLYDGTTVLGTATPQNRTATFVVDSLVPGPHDITVRYSGDSAWRAASSPVLAQKVVTEKTITTLTIPNTDLAYGAQAVLTADVQTTIPGDRHGAFLEFVDGAQIQNAEIAGSSPPLVWWVYGLEPGTHTLYVRYEGSASQPPGTSNVVTVTIHKGQSRTRIDAGTYRVDQYKPMQLPLTLDSDPASGAPPAGWVRVYEGDQLLTGAYADNFGFSGGTRVNITLPPWLQPGTHRVHVVYEGDKHFLGSTSDEITVTVNPAPPPPARRRAR